MTNNKQRKGIPAAAFLATFSSPRHDARQCVNCKVQAARWDSIYCSDACSREFLSFPTEPPKYSVVERWDEQQQKWIEVRLKWDGTAYEEVK